MGASLERSYNYNFANSLACDQLADYFKSILRLCEDSLKKPLSSLISRPVLKQFTDGNDIL